MLVVVATLLGIVATGLSLQAAGAAQGTDTTYCQRFRADSLTRAATVTGSGQHVVVIGDSWSAGLGLRDSADSWPVQLQGRVSVAGFSGSGFSEGASACDRVSFADRAAAAVRRGADLVVVEGGLNDVDQSNAQITAGFERLMRVLDGHRVVIVGPAVAPARARWVPRVDALLARLAAAHRVPYLPTADLRLAYLADRLHLTPAGHRAFGRAVAARLVERKITAGS